VGVDDVGGPGGVFAEEFFFGQAELFFGLFDRGQKAFHFLGDLKFGENPGRGFDLPAVQQVGLSR